VGESVYSVWIQAAPAQVWRTYVDPHRIPEWQTGKPVVGDVRGAPGEPGSTYVSKRGPLHARTTVLTSDVPAQLVTRTDAYLGLQLEVTSRISDRAGGADLELTAVTHWPQGRRLIGKLVERIVLSPREARKELTNLRVLIERETAE